MAAGVIVQGICVPQAQAAGYAASYADVFVNPGFTTYFSELVDVAGVLTLNTYSITSGGQKTQVSSVPYTAYGYACDTSDNFFDGMALGWGVVLAMAVAWGIHVLRRGL